MHHSYEFTSFRIRLGSDLHMAFTTQPALTFLTGQFFVALSIRLGTGIK